MQQLLQQLSAISESWQMQETKTKSIIHAAGSIGCGCGCGCDCGCGPVSDSLPRTTGQLDSGWTTQPVSQPTS
ncbi:hypothetical protein AWZ03_011183 [Drosophila navojoa]|uniref:Uncharacterized protein n=1 Tax=Drosophila navojoa TaxID=7232 RepID=A0A484B0Z4_DRONA|nr:hypothetical protein AWZ03_011183 [Drosophila navojoa]